MKTVDTHGTFEEAISRSSSHVAAIARLLRELILEVDPNVVEVPWPHQQIIGYGVGPKKMTEHYCYIAPQKEYANLGFYYGAVLPDPEGLLEGTGKVLRHVKVRESVEVSGPALRQLVQLALEERRKTLVIKT
ncbi:MAG TPA: DUF1801 domain-containing protein [Anaerolineales bacterium]|nr:DUF1801 domain-containing protein [Anaerolineales bacterium]